LIICLLCFQFDKEPRIAGFFVSVVSGVPLLSGGKPQMFNALWDILVVLGPVSQDYRQKGVFRLAKGGRDEFRQ